MKYIIIIPAFLAIALGFVWFFLQDADPLHASDPALVSSGENVFNQYCSTCHAADTTPIAPGLAGLLGRRAGSTSFPNSSALSSAGFEWTAERLNAFLTDPRGYIPGNQMAFFGLEDAADRDALIAYIAAL